MMLLSVDTSMRMGGVALGGDEGLLWEVTFRIAESYSQSLMMVIDQMMKGVGAERDEISGFAVALGPGSFTSLRIGLATVKGLAYSLRRPVAGIPTLDSLALSLPYSPYLICPIIDARRGEVYTCLYRFNPALEEMEALTPYQVLPPDRLAQKLEGEVIFTGDGVDRYGALLKEIMGKRAHFAPLACRAPRASNLIPIALRRLKEGKEDDLSRLAPLYIRRPQAQAVVDN